VVIIYFKNLLKSSFSANKSGPLWKCPILLGFLSRLRNGEQTAADYEMLKARRIQAQDRDFTTGMRAITQPTNRTKQLFNIEAALQWAPKHRKHMSIFLSMHEWIRTKKSSFTLDGTSRTEKHCLYIPDDSKIKIPPLYIHIPGTPVMTTENEHPGLKHVNGAEFKGVAVIPDARYPGYAISEGITIHFGPPAGLLVTSEDIKDIQVPGLDRGTILITPKQTVISKKKKKIRLFADEQA
jgi:hypothetical protein